jgi:CelD/BcsL family acetyltransferase involved in cellulose biosynthesis
MSDIIKFSMLSSESEFNSLREPWNDLLSQSDLASVAQTWEWQRNWWDIYGKDRQLNIIVGRENDKIVGIAPFSTTKQKRKRAGFIPYKTIYYLSTGVVSGRNVVSEYLDFIVCMERRREFVSGVLKWLVQYMDWDEILIESVSAESDLPALMKEGSAFLNLRFEITKDLPSVLIKLPQSWSVYLETADSTLRYKINRGRREFEKVKGKYERIDDEGGLADAFLELERLHQHRWESRGGAGAFSDPKWREFHRRFILFAHRNGWLRLSFLLLDGKAVSANYNFAFHEKIHFFQSGIIPHENKHLRLG